MGSSQSDSPLPDPSADASPNPPSSPPPCTPRDTNPIVPSPPKTSNPVNPTETASPSISKQTLENGFVVVENQKNVSETPTSLYPIDVTIDVTVPPPSISHYSTDGQRRPKPNYQEDGPSARLGCSVCNDKPNIFCGTCEKYSKPNTTMQNNTMESSFIKRNGACPNAIAGCTFKVSAGALGHHKQDCYYRSIACPRGGCYWENCLADVLEHFYSDHVVNPQQRIVLNKNFTFKVLLGEPVTDVQILQHHEYNKQHNYNQLQPTTNYNPRKLKKHYFIYTFRSNADLLQWTLQRYGSDTYASSWLYDLTLIDNADPNRQIIWTEKCESDAQYSQTLMNTGRCVTVPLSVAKNFMSSGKRITIKIFVRPKKMQE